MIYFASDFHLGVDGRLSSEERERLIVQWLDDIKDKAETIYLVGDIFDFWYEYKTVIPKGYMRLQAKWVELIDRGIQIELFTGNHDMWMFDYFTQELGIPVHRKPIEREHGGKKFLIGHGDGLGPGDHGYKRIKKVFANPLAQRLFGLIPPGIGMRIAQFWSGKSRDHNREAKHFLGAKDEWLVQYCERCIGRKPYDYLIFGHRHLPIDYTLSNGTSRYINLGEWISAQSFAHFDGKELTLEFYKNPEGSIYGKD